MKYELIITQLLSVKKYLDGDWAEARDILSLVDICVQKRIHKICLPEDVMKLALINEDVLGDGPSRTLLNYMGKYNFKPPLDWDPNRGRTLASK